MFDCAPLSSASHTQPLVPLQQSEVWLRATCTLGSDARRERVGDACVLTLRKSLPIIGELALLSRAQLNLTAEGAANLRETLGARHLIVNSDTFDDAVALAQAGFHNIGAPRMVAELPLDAPPEQMAHRLAPKWRNRLRHGQSQRLELRRRLMPADPDHWLLRAEATQSARLWYQPLPPEMIAALAASKPGCAQLFTAYHLGQRICAMLFLRHGGTATYQIGWTTEEGRKRSAGPVLMWRAMVELQQMGVSAIDLGAADPERAPGLVRFKRGTGAELRALGGTWLDTSWARRKRQSARHRVIEELRGTRHTHLLSTARAVQSTR
ncbi:GNAT family N-acetyltransferase [Gymnodinialimonas hymeniacidonis]|uniref:GNAT family N-acetyltransferase n=1 Tax=Gymnodinialimonas hymeniacidonis TaxID=3126508 RepID=UPI0034C5F61E